MTSILLVFDGSLRSPIRAIRAVDENGYDEQTANIKGRIWYVALKRRF